MPQCPNCSKRLANPSSLRRHVNTQHEFSDFYVCLCGRRFADPAARSRCKTSHLKSFGCPAPGCKYQSGRKDSVRQHIQRIHPHEAASMEVHIKTLPPRCARSGQSPIPPPVPSEPIASPMAFTFQQPPLYAPIPLPWVPQSSPPYSDASTTSDSWSPFG